MLVKTLMEWGLGLKSYHQPNKKLRLKFTTKKNNNKTKFSIKLKISITLGT